MQMLRLAIEIGKVLAYALAVAIPCCIVIKKKAKELRNAKSEAEKIAAVNDIRSKAKTLVQTAEVAYHDIDSIMKSHSLGSAGQFKKESVQAKLESYSSKKGYTFTEDELSDIIEDEVSFTNTVNSNK